MRHRICMIKFIIDLDIWPAFTTQNMRHMSQCFGLNDPFESRLSEKSLFTFRVASATNTNLN